MAKITGEDILKIALANPDVIVPPEALEAGKAKAGKSKYHNVRCEFMGIKFASKAESRRYGELRLLELNNEISQLEVQPVYLLTGGVKYKGDFQYTENGKTICEEVKGFETTSWKIKKRLFLELYPDIELRIIK